jgi:ATP-dependent Clp protease ATP-binding subunit ClpA
MPRRLAFLSPEAQEALDIAKRAVPSGATLTPELLMAAAFRTAGLEDEAPQLAPYLPPPVPLSDEVPDEVGVTESLRSVLGALSRSDMVTVHELLAALVNSDAGHGFLASAGMPEAEIEAAAAVLAGLDHPEQGAGTGAGANAENLPWRSSEARQSAIEALSTFGRMLTVGEPPHKGVMRMDRYLRALEKSLLKMRRPSVIVIGQPGTGKTALVYEFARLIVEESGTLAPGLRDRDVFELSPSFLRSGASMVGQYDERISTLIRTLEANPQVILFVDEVHSLLQSGMHERGPFTDANESFKTAVGRGAFSLIGATTTSEYRHYIAPDGALARRFGLVKIDPPTPEETVAILQGRASQYRDHYAPLRIPDSILAATVRITEDVIPTRFQPDKSLELLDEACALCTMTDPPLEEVTEGVLLRAVEDTIGHSVVQPGMLTEGSVLEQLRAKIVGQDAALSAIARGFVAGLSEDWLQHDGPRRIFFFCGPTGVGKTETAKMLSTILGGGREAILRIDCNTLQGSGSEDPGPVINRLLGVSAGYIGYARGEGGLLSRIRDVPESVVLFDEIEKASPAISKILLQILDEGRVEDADGNLLDFRRAFFVFTTNAGATYEAKRSLGFQAGVSRDRAGESVPTVSAEAVKADLRQRGYGEEFFGRQIDFIVFEAMERADVEVVLGHQLESLRDTAELRGYDLEWEPDVVAHLLAEWTPRFGARWVFNILRNRIVEQLALADAQGELEGVTRIHLVLRPDAGQDDARQIAGLAGRRREDDTLTVLVA